MIYYSLLNNSYLSVLANKVFHDTPSLNSGVSRYSYRHMLTFGYLIGPMEMRSFTEAVEGT